MVRRLLFLSSLPPPLRKQPSLCVDSRGGRADSRRTDSTFPGLYFALLPSDISPGMPQCMDGTITNTTAYFTSNGLSQCCHDDFLQFIIRLINRNVPMEYTAYPVCIQYCPYYMLHSEQITWRSVGKRSVSGARESASLFCKGGPSPCGPGASQFRWWNKSLKQQAARTIFSSFVTARHFPTFFRWLGGKDKNFFLHWLNEWIGIFLYIFLWIFQF